MPEGLEAELYRRAAEVCVGRVVATVDVDPRQQLAIPIGRELVGSEVTGMRRIGKLVLVDLSMPDGDSVVLGLHFGMTGRLVVDGIAPIERLEYSSGRDDPAWDRLLVGFDGVGSMRVNDPRRWARFTLDPDETRFGPDLLDHDVATFTDALAESLAGRRAALKSILLDQSIVAGLGNMTVDEILWQVGFSPLAPAGQLEREPITRLVDAIDEHLPAMLVRGGSHTGVLEPAIRSGLPPCPRDGVALRRDVVGGRSTVWCPGHQTANGRSS